MSRTLYGGFERVDLLVLPDEAEALAHLRLHRADAQDMATLRRLLDEEMGLRGVDRLTDQEVLEQVARLMAGGRIAGAGYTPSFRAVQGVRTGTSREGGAGGAEEGGSAAGREPAATSSAQQSTPGGPVEAPPPESVVTTWVEIELVDEKGEPVGGEAYWIRTASGKAITGRLDRQGRARVRGIDPGSCEITFPDLNATDWAQV
ncbi:hypothetical protein AWN76_001515 [Rhodothermaceae bacterium RA]|nr:hypothetical protein AWN76_001515 [Rhodothermaceae bacterium RA]